MTAQPFSKCKEKKANKSNENFEFSKIKAAVPDGITMNQIYGRPSSPAQPQSVVHPQKYNPYIPDT